MPMGAPSERSSISGAKIAAIGGGVFAAMILLAGAVILMGGSSDATNTLEESGKLGFNVTDPEPSDYDYCINPEAVAGAAKPATTGQNRFDSFVNNDAYGWRPFNHVNPTEDFAPDDAATYALCISGTPTGDSRKCTGYEGGRSHEIFEMDYNIDLYRYSDGERVTGGTVRGEEMSCPLAITTPSTNQSPREFDIAMITADYMQPDVYADPHLSRDLDFANPAWCTSSPVALPKAGTAATEPAAWLLSTGNDRGSADKLPSVGAPAEQVTHVACAVFSPDGSKERCRFNGGPDLEIFTGAYSVTVVALATGDVVASQDFTGSTSCPGVRLSDGPTVEAATIPDSAYDFILASAGS